MLNENTMYILHETYADLMSYRSYEGTAEISLADNCLYGKIFGITDLVSYEGKTVKALKKAFAKAVDDYIETRQELDNPHEKFGINKLY